MTKTDLLPSPEALRQFDSLEDLTTEQLQLLSRSLPIHQVKKGARLVRRGDTGRFSLLLLTGAVELVAEDGRRKRIQAGSPSARSPIAQLVPRRYDVTAIRDSGFVKLNTDLLNELREFSARLHQASQMTVVDESAGIDGYESLILHDEELLTQHIRRDLENNCLVLPSLPDIALRIGRALDEESTNAEHIARIIQADPAMTAKIVRTANSALYAGITQVDSCVAAVVRLGMITTHRLVLSFALREIFRARSPVIRGLMEELWHHSTRVASICHVLARLIGRFNPEQAMLAGLVHDIGNVAILSYVENLPDLANNKPELRRAMTTLRGILGEAILERWQFIPELITVAREAEYWSRNPTPQPDLCDLVIIAQLHSYVGNPRAQELPHLGQLPCFAKLELGELTPRQSLQILEEADEELRSAEQLLRF